MYQHVKKYEIKYSDFDAFDRLKLSSLLCFLQESACLSADELDFGYKDLAPKNFGFIIVNNYLRLFREIKLGEELTLRTWPLPPKHMIFTRDFELYCGDEKVGVCTTRWCMINTLNYTMMPTSAFFGDRDFSSYNTSRAVEFNGWKIISPTDAEKVYSKEVKFSDYDHYGHVNNTKYADFLMDVFSPDELKDKSIESAQINYVKQCKFGEKIDFTRAFCDGYYVVEGSVGGELRVQLRLKFNEIQV